jgi:hypothetical protein
MNGHHHEARHPAAAPPLLHDVPNHPALLDAMQAVPAPKRRKASATAATTAAAAAALPPATVKVPAAVASAAAAAANAARPGRLRTSRSRSPQDIPLAQLPPDFPHIFKGCRLMFTPGSGAPLGLQQRASQLGATVTLRLTPDTTHVIARCGWPCRSQRSGAAEGICPYLCSL